ncbi:hypothetical protein BDZ97DRAFT_194221 [Flammula alnicola]|nr:hypothetical protein BDZ97DRAFT_194221 [Flammula alnicola]
MGSFSSSVWGSSLHFESALLQVHLIFQASSISLFLVEKKQRGSDHALVLWDLRSPWSPNHSAVEEQPRGFASCSLFFRWDARKTCANQDQVIVETHFMLNVALGKGQSSRLNVFPNHHLCGERFFSLASRQLPFKHEVQRRRPRQRLGSSWSSWQQAIP